MQFNGMLSSFVVDLESTFPCAGKPCSPARYLRPDSHADKRKSDFGLIQCLPGRSKMPMAPKSHSIPALHVGEVHARFQPRALAVWSSTEVRVPAVWLPVRPPYVNAARNSKRGLPARRTFRNSKPSPNQRSQVETRRCARH